MTSTSAPIVLAAGGTGGHLFPAEALAKALIKPLVPIIADEEEEDQATAKPSEPEGDEEPLLTH